MKAIYKLDKYYGRMGDLTGIFVAEKEIVECMIEHEIIVQFGEVLGKHSDIHCSINDSDITMCSDDQAAIKVVEDLRLENGFNPLDYTSIGFDGTHLPGYEEDYEYTVGELCELIIKNKKSKYV